MRPVAPVLLSATLLACGSESSREPVVSCPPPGELVDGVCLEPLPEACEPGSRTAVDGSCLPAGVPLGGCPVGFSADGAGPCLPILPPEPCPPGTMAIPGDVACRTVMPCGQGPWGDLPVDDATTYVDQSYAAGFNDGSAARPFTTINEALLQAPGGGLIAVAAGTYEEDVHIMARPLRLWGRCPDMVEIVGTGDLLAAVAITSAAASGTEIGGLSVTGPRTGVFSSGALDLVLDRLRIHDTQTHLGFEINAGEGPSSVVVRDSLFERNALMGGFIAGALAEFERVQIRDSQPRPGTLDLGRALTIVPSCPGACDASKPSSVRITQSLLEGSAEYGVLLSGSELVAEGVVLRNTLPRVADGSFGIGWNVTECPASEGCDPPSPSTATFIGGLVENNLDTGIRNQGSTIEIDGTVVRGTKPREADLLFGRGVTFEGCGPLEGCQPARIANGHVGGAFIESNHDLGLFIMGSEATVDGSVVRATIERAWDDEVGRGISIQHACYDSGCDIEAPARATISNSLVEDNHDAGIYVQVSDARIEDSLIRRTLPQLDGLYGDGVQVAAYEGAGTTATLRGVRIEDNTRAGVASFGGAIDLGDTRIGCSAFALTGAPYLDHDPELTDAGGNLCGCPEPDAACKLVDPGLLPPSPP